MTMGIAWVASLATLAGIFLLPGPAIALPSVPPISWRASPPTADCFSPPTDGAGRFWYEAGFDASSWTPIGLPSQNDVPSDRIRFYRGAFNLDGNASAAISFNSDDGITIYVNGVFKGHWGGLVHE